MSEFLSKKDAAQILTLLAITNRNIASLTKAMFGEGDLSPDSDPLAKFGHYQLEALKTAREAIETARARLEAGLDLRG